MTVRASINTYLRRALQEVPWDGPRFVALFGYLTGLVPDTLAEAHRQAARMLLPVPESPVDILPYLARAMGVPMYPARDTSTPTGYASTLTRLQSTLSTHAVAGSMDGLTEELFKAGLTSVEVQPDADQEAQAFNVAATSDPPEVYGTGISYGDGTIYGRQLPSAQARGLLAVMAYFRPAGARFRNVVAP